MLEDQIVVDHVTLPISEWMGNEGCVNDVILCQIFNIPGPFPEI